MTLATCPRIGDLLPERQHLATNVSLFLYNAAVWNAHRIHYDEAYMTTVEHHPGIVIDGPLQGDWLSQVVLNWLGESGVLLEFAYTNRRAAYLGETLTAGGRVTGIIPRHLARAEVEHGGLTELIETETMSQRKIAMIERADAFVVLPGGIGTLDELLEVVTLRQLRQHDKPTVMIDLGGYWTPLRALLDHIVAEEYARPDILDFMLWVERPSDLPVALGLAGA